MGRSDIWQMHRYLWQSGREWKYNHRLITSTFWYLQNQCATKVDEEGKYISYKRGTCGSNCPGEDDDVWLSDVTLAVTHHQKSKEEENSLDNSDLPDTLLVSSTSSAAETWPSLMGVYRITNKTYSGKPVWGHIFNSYQLYYSGNLLISISISWLEISGVSAQWMVGAHLINSEKEDGADIPTEDWLYEDTFGEWQNDETMTVISNSI